MEPRRDRRGDAFDFSNGSSRTIELLQWSRGVIAAEMRLLEEGPRARAGFNGAAA